MTYKNTFDRILMTSVVAITAMFAQEVWASKRTFEEYVDPNAIGNNGIPVKQPRYEQVLLQNNAVFPANQGFVNHNHHNNNGLIAAPVQNFGFQNPQPFANQYAQNQQPGLMQQQQLQIPQQNYGAQKPQPFGNHYVQNQQPGLMQQQQKHLIPHQTYGAPYQLEFNLNVYRAVAPAPVFQQNFQLAQDESKFNALQAQGYMNWHSGYKCLYLVLSIDNCPHIEYRFDPFKMLPENDGGLINSLCEKIKICKNIKKPKTRINKFVRNLSQLLLSENAAELSLELRTLITKVVNSYDADGAGDPYIVISDLFAKTGATKNYSKFPITSKSPILKGLNVGIPTLLKEFQDKKQAREKKDLEWQFQLEQLQKKADEERQQPLFVFPQPLKQPQDQNIEQPAEQKKQPVQPQQNDAPQEWKYDRTNAKNATPDEVQLYEDIRTKVLELDTKVGPIAAQRVLETIGDVETLHKNNIEICEELFNGKMLFSKKFYGVVLHGEQRDSNLELRANNMYLIYFSVWNALKDADDEPLFIDFFKNAFTSSDRKVCLEGRTGSADNWHQKNKSKLSKTKLSFEEQIKQKTVEENIIAHSNIIFAQFMENSKDGRYLKLLRKTSEKNQAAKARLNNALNNPIYHDKKAQIEERLAEIQMNIEALQTHEAKFAPKFETKETYQAMFEKLAQELEGKEAKDGMMTREQMKEYLINCLVWDLD